MRRLTFIISLTAVVAAAVMVSMILAQEQSPTATPTILSAFDAIDTFRAANGLPAYVYETPLMAHAREVAEMVADGADPSAEAVKSLLQTKGLGVINLTLAYWTSGEGLAEALHYLPRRHPEVLSEQSDTHFAVGRATLPADRYVYVALVMSLNSCNPVLQELNMDVQIAHAEEMLALVNVARQKGGLNALVLDTDRLYAAARWYSDDMKAYGYPTNRPGGQPHIGTDGSGPGERITRAGYYASVSRENILMRYTLDAQGAFDMWWNSPGHKANMLADDVSVMVMAFTCNVNTGEFFYTQLLAEPFVMTATDTRAADVIRLVNDTRTASGLPALVPVQGLSDYGDLLAAYLIEHNDFPANAWEDLMAVYPMRDGTIFSGQTSGDAIDALAFLMAYNSNDLLNISYTQIGLGVIRDDRNARYVYVVVLAAT